MNKLLNYFFLLLIGVGLGYFLFNSLQNNTKPIEDASFIFEKIEEVNKLVTLESYISEVYTIDESKKLFYDLIPIEKKALIIAKGRVQISYDLDQLDVQVNEEQKTITISNLPKPEYIVEPELNYYDIKANVMPFTKDDLSRVSNRAIQLLKEEAKKSHLQELAEKNLEVHLKELILLSKENGWQLIIQK